MIVIRFTHISPLYFGRIISHFYVFLNVYFKLWFLSWYPAFTILGIWMHAILNITEHIDWLMDYNDIRFVVFEGRTELMNVDLLFFSDLTVLILIILPEPQLFPVYPGGHAHTCPSGCTLWHKNPDGQGLLLHAGKKPWVYAIYTARQLSGSTLPVPLFCPRQYLKYLLRLTDKLLWSITTFFLSHSAFFLGSPDLPNWPKSSVAHLCWSHSDVRCRCRQITILNQSGNPANQYPACNYLNIVQTSEGDVENHGIITRCHLKSPKPCLREQQYYVGIYWKRLLHKKTSPFYVSWSEKVVVCVQYPGWASQANRAPCLCTHGPRRFSSSCKLRCSMMGPESTSIILVVVPVKQSTSLSTAWRKLGYVH